MSEKIICIMDKYTYDLISNEINNFNAEMDDSLNEIQVLRSLNSNPEQIKKELEAEFNKLYETKNMFKISNFFKDFTKELKFMAEYYKEKYGNSTHLDELVAFFNNEKLSRVMINMVGEENIPRSIFDVLFRLTGQSRDQYLIDLKKTYDHRLSELKLILNAKENQIVINEILAKKKAIDI